MKMKFYLSVVSQLRKNLKTVSVDQSILHDQRSIVLTPSFTATVS